MATIAQNYVRHIARTKRTAQRRLHRGGHRQQTPERTARHIAEAIALRGDEGRAWSWDEFGIADNAAMRAMVEAALATV